MTDPLGLISSSTPSLGAGTTAALRAAAPSEGPSFKDTLIDQIQRVNEMQVNADQAIEDFTTGQGNLENVLLATKKADTAFRMLLQVRNKVMDAYEEVKQIRV